MEKFLDSLKNEILFCVAIEKELAANFLLISCLLGIDFGSWFLVQEKIMMSRNGLFFWVFPFFMETFKIFYLWTPLIH